MMFFRKRPRAGESAPSTSLRAVIGDHYDVLLQVLLERSAALAEQAGETGLDDVEDLITDLVQGYAQLSYEGKRARVRELLADAQGALERAPVDLEALEQYAAWLDGRALEADADAAGAEAEIRTVSVGLSELLRRYGKLPLLLRGSARFAFVTAPATAAGLGVLVKLALAAVDDQVASWALVGAAVLGVLGAEAVLGLLGAALYERLAPERRPRALLITFIVIMLMVFTTEGFAVFARQQGVNATNAGPVIDPRSGAIAPSASPATPSLIWTGPLSILLTLAGAGALGARSLQESTKPRRERIKKTKADLEAAEQHRREALARAEGLRAEARDARLRGADKLASAKAEVARGPILIDALQAEGEMHVQVAKAADAEAKLRYYIARNAPRPMVTEPPNPGTSPGERLAIGLGSGVAGGALVAAVGATLPLAVGVGGVLLVASMLAGRLLRGPLRAAVKGVSA